MDPVDIFGGGLTILHPPTDKNQNLFILGLTYEVHQVCLNSISKTHEFGNESCTSNVQVKNTYYKTIKGFFSK